MEHGPAVSLINVVEGLGGDRLRVEVSLESAGIDHGEAGVQLGHAVEVDNVLRNVGVDLPQREGEQLGDLHGFADASALDDQVVEPLLLSQFSDLCHEVLSE